MLTSYNLTSRPAAEPESVSERLLGPESGPLSRHCDVPPHRINPSGPNRPPGPTDVLSGCKLQALVYDILPSTTAVFSYATGVQKTVS